MKPLLVEHPGPAALLRSFMVGVGPRQVEAIRLREHPRVPYNVAATAVPLWRCST